MIITVQNLDLGDISVSGQCFRLNEIYPGIFSLVSFGKVLFLAQKYIPSPDGASDSSTVVLSCDKEEFNGIWRDYFDLDNDYPAFIKSIPADDQYLTRAAEYGSGIRILKQDPWEMLITFIISQRKNMPAIRNCVETVCSRFGNEITPDKEAVDIFAGECAEAGSIGEKSECEDLKDAASLKSALLKLRFYSFPDAAVLAALPLEAITACSTGYRDKYILESAKRAASGDLDLEAMKGLSTEDLFSALKDIYGVGEKVANCILLFGYHRLEAFPIDVWIKRILDREYGGTFDTSAYKGYAGVIQQYMFFYETSSK